MTESAISTTEAHVVRSLARAGAIAAAAGALLTILWLLTIIAAPLPPDGSTVDHLRDLRAHDVERSIAFVIVAPLGFTFVPVWVALAARAWRRHPSAAALTVAFGVMYAPLSATAYWLQLSAARGIADAYAQDPAGAVAAYRLFDFGTTASFTFALDILGYAVLGVGTIAASALLRADGRLGGLAGALLACSGALSIAGAIGLAIRSSALQIGAVASGPPFLVAIVVVAGLLWRESAAARTSAEGAAPAAAY